MALKWDFFLRFSTSIKRHQGQYCTISLRKVCKVIFRVPIKTEIQVKSKSKANIFFSQRFFISPCWLIRMIFQTSGIRRCKIRGKKEKKGERETERGASLPDMFKHNNMTPNRPRKIGRVCAMCYYAQNKIFHGWSKIHTNLRKKGTKLSKVYLKKWRLLDFCIVMFFVYLLFLLNSLVPWFPHSVRCSMWKSRNLQITNKLYSSFDSVFSAFQINDFSGQKIQCVAITKGLFASFWRCQANLPFLPESMRVCPTFSLTAFVTIKAAAELSLFLRWCKPDANFQHFVAQKSYCQ